VGASRYRIERGNEKREEERRGSYFRAIDHGPKVDPVDRSSRRG